MAFNEYLKAAREKADLGVNELARVSGVSAPYLSRLEKGNRKPPMPDVLKKLAPHLKVDYNDLMQAAGWVIIPDDPKYKELESVNLTDEYIAKGLSEADIRRILDSVLETLKGKE